MAVPKAAGDLTEGGSHWDEGVRLELAGDWDGALAAYTRAEIAGETPRHPRALICHGEYLESREQFDDAERAFREAARASDVPAAAKAWDRLHRCALRRGDVNAAEAALRSVIATGDNEEAPRAHRNLGTLLEDHRRDIAGARHEYETAIASEHPMHVQGAKVNLAQLYEREGHTVEARRMLDDVVASNHPAEGPRAQYLLGTLLLSQGDDAAALEVFESAMVAGNAEWAPRAALEAGNMYFSSADLDRAASAFDLAENISDPEVAQTAAFFLGVVEKARGREAAAEAAFRRVIDASQGAPTAVACGAAKNLGTFALQRSQFADARRYLSLATHAEMPEESARAYLLLGICEQQAGSSSDAVQAFQRAAATPGVPSEIHDLARQNLARLGCA